MQEEWGYPEIGICVCNCPSAGHDMIMLDYRKSGNDGEPEVVHVDQERDYRITFLAKNFEEFTRGLVNESVYDTSAEDLEKKLAAIERGTFSKLLTRLVAGYRKIDFEPIIRGVCRSLAIEKGFFALHADEKSYLLYDIQFHLYTTLQPVRTEQEYLKTYPEMIAGDGDLTTGGYAPDFIKDWLDKRRSDGDIIASAAASCRLARVSWRNFRPDSVTQWRNLSSENASKYSWIVFGALVACAWSYVRRPVHAQEPAKTQVDAAALEEGQSLFRGLCSGCHGGAGRGGKGPDLTRKKYSHGSSDAEIINTIKNGVPKTTMKKLGDSLKDDQIAKLLLFIRSLQSAPPGNDWKPYLAGDPKVGRQIFFDPKSKVQCAKCHTVTAR